MNKETRPKTVYTSDVTTKPTWGHPILTPEGDEIRLPQSAFAHLRQLGLLLPNRNAGLFQIADTVHAFMSPECETLMGGLRRLLGHDLEGPEWLVCNCGECCRLKEEADKTPLPRTEEKRRGRYWLKVIRTPRHSVSQN